MNPGILARRVPVRHLTGVAIGTAVLLLSACGGSSTSQPPQVASIRSTATAAGAAAATPSAEADAGRPQLRVDTTEEEHQRLINAWSSCLKTQGVPTYTKGGWLFPEAGDDEFPAAFKTCRKKQPLQSASLDPARNPQYAEEKRQWIKCINQKSPVIKIKGTPDGWTYADDSESSEAEYDAFNKTVDACEIEAFGRE